MTSRVKSADFMQRYAVCWDNNGEQNLVIDPLIHTHTYILK